MTTKETTQAIPMLVKKDWTTNAYHLYTSDSIHDARIWSDGVIEILGKKIQRERTTIDYRDIKK